MTPEEFWDSITTRLPRWWTPRDEWRDDVIRAARKAASPNDLQKVHDALVRKERRPSLEELDDMIRAARSTLPTGVATSAEEARSVVAIHEFMKKHGLWDAYINLDPEDWVPIHRYIACERMRSAYWERNVYDAVCRAPAIDMLRELAEVARRDPRTVPQKTYQPVAVATDWHKAWHRKYYPAYYRDLVKDDVEAVLL